VLISISDNGEGMSDDVRQRAFEPLFTTKVRGAGTGLGLAQVLAACEQAGGTARITSVHGAGTTVRLYLPHHHAAHAVAPEADVPPMPPLPSVSPVSPAPESVVEAHQQARGHELRGMSVLLVEDNADVAAGVAAVLEVFGCTVHHEQSADAAFELLGQGYGFDLVLSDIQMPGNMNGVDLAEQIIERLPSQKVVLMTGYADELERARHLGVTILAKPFEMEELRELVAPGVAQ
jgi:CheY-like chemotaxis protein